MNQNTLTYIAITVSFLPVIFGIKKWSNPIWWCVLLGFITNFLLVFVIEELPVKGIVANIFLWIEFLIIFDIYKRYGIFKNFPWLKIVALVILFMEMVHTIFINNMTLNHVASIFDNFSLSAISSNMEHFNGLGASCFFAFYILLSIFSFFIIIKQQKYTFLEQSTFFWFNTAVIINSSGIFILFLFINYMISHNMQPIIARLWFVNNSLDIIKSLLILIGLLQKKP